jgi:hypothetical protein
MVAWKRRAVLGLVRDPVFANPVLTHIKGRFHPITISDEVRRVVKRQVGTSHVPAGVPSPRYPMI